MSAVDAVRRRPPAASRATASTSSPARSARSSSSVWRAANWRKFSSVRRSARKARQQTLDRRRHRGRGQPEPDGPRDRLVAADRAADAEVVGVDERAVDLDLLALDAEVGDPVLAAAVRAAGDVDPQLLVEARQALLQALHQPAREALGLGERQLAELGAGARDGAAPERRGVEREAGGLELARQGLGARAARRWGSRGSACWSCGGRPCRSGRRGRRRPASGRS